MSHQKIFGLRRVRGAVVAIIAAMLMSTALSGVGNAKRSPDVDPAVITSWNATAVATIVVDAGKANAEAFLYYAFTQAAVYNAVEGITREYQLYDWNMLGPRSASPEAAAAAAAHRVLLHYFPASQSRLDAALAASLDGVADGSAKDQGIAYGERAADRIIQLRENDGRNAPVTFDEPATAGVWRPTPPTNAPFFAPWLSQVKPLTMTSPTQFRPGPPPALTSARYTAEFNEVKELGASDSETRTAPQTQTAWFFFDTGVGPLQGSLRDLATRHQMDISDSARLFAAVDVSIADAVIATWDAKVHYGFWRPITAIQLAADDDNPATEADGDWAPLFATPPYAEYTSGLVAVMSSASRAVSHILGGGEVDLYITSVAAGMGGPPVTRHYELASTLVEDAIDARVWAGIHFRTADVRASVIGNSVADWSMDHEFQPA
jgi:hypothetical protein